MVFSQLLYGVATWDSMLQGNKSPVHEITSLDIPVHFLWKWYSIQYMFIPHQHIGSSHGIPFSVFFFFVFLFYGLSISDYVVDYTVKLTSIIQLFIETGRTCTCNYNSLRCNNFHDFVAWRKSICTSPSFHVDLTCYNHTFRMFAQA